MLESLALWTDVDFAFPADFCLTVFAVDELHVEAVVNLAIFALHLIALFDNFVFFLDSFFFFWFPIAFDVQKFSGLLDV